MRIVKVGPRRRGDAIQRVNGRTCGRGRIRKDAPPPRPDLLYTNPRPLPDSFGTAKSFTRLCAHSHIASISSSGTMHRARRFTATAQRRSVYAKKVSFICRRISGCFASHSGSGTDHDLRASHQRRRRADSERDRLSRRHEPRSEGRRNRALHLHCSGGSRHRPNGTAHGASHRLHVAYHTGDPEPRASGTGFRAACQPTPPRGSRGDGSWHDEHPCEAWQRHQHSRQLADQTLDRAPEPRKLAGGKSPKRRGALAKRRTRRGKLRQDSRSGNDPRHQPAAVRGGWPADQQRRHLY